ncbi:MAG: hypothetical protein KJN60_10095 [Boseongicola sp.]|nr:hypothetical protein [Boseongicola sp.]
MNPAEKVIAKFGTLREFAAITGISYNAAYKWTKAGYGNPECLVPTEHFVAVCRAAEKHGVMLDLKDFLPDRVE